MREPRVIGSFLAVFRSAVHSHADLEVLEGRLAFKIARAMEKPRARKNSEERKKVTWGPCFCAPLTPRLAFACLTFATNSLAPDNNPAPGVADCYPPRAMDGNERWAATSSGRTRAVGGHEQWAAMSSRRQRAAGGHERGHGQKRDLDRAASAKEFRLEETHERQVAVPLSKVQAAAHHVAVG